MHVLCSSPIRGRITLKMERMNRCFEPARFPELNKDVDITTLSTVDRGEFLVRDKCTIKEIAMGDGTVRLLLCTVEHLASTGPWVSPKLVKLQPWRISGLTTFTIPTLPTRTRHH
jgi:hypothetical protein